MAERIDPLARESVEARIRERAREMLPDRLLDDHEVRLLVRVLLESCLLPDIYSTERIARIMSDGLQPSPDLLPSAGSAPEDLLRRVRRLPDQARLVGDKALFDAGVSGLTEVQGYDLLELGARSYRRAGEVLELLAEDRALREFFKENRMLVLPLEEEAVFLRQCSDRFGTYAELLQRVAGEGGPTPEDLDAVRRRVPLMAAVARALQEETPAGDEDAYVDAARKGQDRPRSREAQLAAAERLLRFASLDLPRLESALEATVVGQAGAVRTLVDEFALYAAGTRDPLRPPGYFLVGPTGVGKNHLVESLRRVLEGLWEIEVPVLTIEGPSYTYPSDIHELRGATRGFIRSDEEGILTAFHGKSSRAPLAILLVDEVEKAHPQLRKFFLSILDRGTTTDNRGNEIDLSNCLIFFTSNIGYSAAQQRSAPIGYQDAGDSRRQQDGDVRRDLRRALSPEFVNRLRLVHFERLDREGIDRILDLEFRRIAERYRELHGLELRLGPAAREELIRRGYSPDYGARHLTKTLEAVCNVDLAKRIRADDRRDVDASGQLIEWLREIRAGGRAYDEEEVRRRVAEQARAQLPYAVLEISWDGERFHFAPAED